MRRRAGLVFSMVFIVAVGAGCSKKKRTQSLEQVEEKAEAPASTLLTKFPSDDPVAGSKSYPLRLITTTNLSGRLKEGGASTSWPFALIDARTRVEYENEHINGAINCPAEQVEAKLGSLVQDKSREIVFYCNGPNCTKSHKAGRAAVASGFTRVAVYDEGMPAWKAASLSVTGDPLPKVEVAKLQPSQLDASLKTKGVTVVDIRPRDEYLVFRIAGAVNVSLDDLESKLGNHAKLNTPLCVADYTGHQQDIAARLLTKLGYTSVKVLDGGMRGWQTANLPVEKGLDKPALAEKEKTPTTTGIAKK